MIKSPTDPFRKIHKLTTQLLKPDNQYDIEETSTSNERDEDPTIMNGTIVGKLAENDSGNVESFEQKFECFFEAIK